jgi:hypothetical protein
VRGCSRRRRPAQGNRATQRRAGGDQRDPARRERQARLQAIVDPSATSCARSRHRRPVDRLARRRDRERRVLYATVGCRRGRMLSTG